MEKPLVLQMFMPPSGILYHKKKEWEMKKKYVIGGIVIGIILLLLIFGNPFATGMSVDRYRQNFISKADKVLKNPNHELRRRIERAHATVTVRRAYVSSCEIETRDGSSNAGKHGENIAKLGYIIHTVWDGKFHKNGYTDLLIVLDYWNGEASVRTAKIVGSNALINVESPEFWGEVAAIGLLLL